MSPFGEVVFASDIIPQKGRSLLIFLQTPENKGLE